MKAFAFPTLRRQLFVASSAGKIAHMSRSRKWRSKESSADRQQARAASTTSKMAEKTDYSTWDQGKLIERVTQLEKELKEKNRSICPPALQPPKKTYKKPHSERAFDPTKYNTRLIALKLAYLGKGYNGFEHHSGNPTPLPTIEEELWKALNKARLIFPKGSHPLHPGEVNWEGTDYSKCGRTDKGVSAFGQVIGIRVRSNRPLGRRRKADEATEGQNNGGHDPECGKQEVNGYGFNTFPRPGGIEIASPPLGPSSASMEEAEPEVLDLEDPEYEEALNFDPIADEIPYASLLNKVLPPDIRILAWCPFPPLDFSARFSCRERRYRYFFTQPAFSPIPHSLESGTTKRIKDGWLDIDAMREAAKMYEGLNDFRNFCKVDGGKQISNFERRIFYSNIEEVDDQRPVLGYVNEADFLPAGSKNNNPKVYTFTLHGSAFLWHQVRHMVAILFLVGQGLEKPSIVAELLNVEKNARRPTYEMATDTPLVLWDCIFPHEDDPDRKDALQWLYVGDGPRNADAKFGPGGLMDNLWSTWRERKIDEMLAGALVGMVATQGGKLTDLSPGEGKAKKSQKVFDGGDAPRLQGAYVPVMKKPLLESVEVINEKYAVRKGFESAADMKMQGFRRQNKISEEATDEGP